MQTPTAFDCSYAFLTQITYLHFENQFLGMFLGSGKAWVPGIPIVKWQVHLKLIYPSMNSLLSDPSNHKVACASQHSILKRS